MNEIMNLPCLLTREELDSKRDEMARLLLREAKVRTESRRTAASAKQAIDAIREVVGRLATEISEKRERRDVEVTRMKDKARGIEETIRIDTGEVVNMRSLTPSERQCELELIDGGNKAADEA